MAALPGSRALMLIRRWFAIGRGQAEDDGQKLVPFGGGREREGVCCRPLSLPLPAYPPCAPPPLGRFLCHDLTPGSGRTRGVRGKPGNVMSGVSCKRGGKNRCHERVFKYPLPPPALRAPTSPTLHHPPSLPPPSPGEKRKGLGKLGLMSPVNGVYLESGVLRAALAGPGSRGRGFPGVLWRPSVQECDLWHNLPCISM